MKKELLLWIGNYLGTILLYTLIIFYGVFERFMEIPRARLLWPFVILCLWQVLIMYRLKIARMRYAAGFKIGFYVLFWISAGSLFIFVAIVGFINETVTGFVLLIAICTVLFISPISVWIGYQIVERKQIR